MQYTPSSDSPAVTVREGPGIPERLLARLWQRRAARQEWFRTHGGARVRVLYPGRPGLSAGPDFRDAILEMEGVGRVRGDVEIHVRQQDWDAHGHTEDPRYNGVVLHAALDVQSGSTGLASGRKAPVVSLAPLLETTGNADAGPHPGLWQLLEERGFPRPSAPEEAAQLLDDAGDVRFLERSRQLRRFLEEEPPDQVLYEGLMEGLGYQHNQHAFSLLAQRAPYPELARSALEISPGERSAAIEGWLVYLSGLARKGTAHKTPQLPRGLGPPMPAEAWHCFRVRPANHPLRRITGAARLVDRLLEPGLALGLRREAGSGASKTLTAALVVERQDGERTAPIGKGRARDLAVNTTLPFLHALAAREGNGTETQARLRLYARFGKCQENEITQEMAERLLEPGWKGIVSTARRQQGLLHLHRVLTGA